MSANPTSRSSGWTTRNPIIVAVLLSIILGGVSGYATGMLARSSPAPQNRTVYIFAQDLHFGDGQTVTGLTTDYIYSISHFVVNRGDTVTIHFYNPTDTTHSFTMDAPYSNDVVVSPATNTTISKADIVLTVNTSGVFNFHCKFHPPQMAGTIVVEG